MMILIHLHQSFTSITIQMNHYQIDLLVHLLNTDPNDVTVRTKIVGFGTTASGIGTHTFKASGQPDSSVNSARLQTNYVKHRF